MPSQTSSGCADRVNRQVARRADHFGMDAIGTPAGDDKGERLSPDEDAALRRLHWFEQWGCDLSNALRTLKDGFRHRDRRSYIRDPFSTVEPSEQRRVDATPQSYWVRKR
jgi:hypothetical protein